LLDIVAQRASAAITTHPWLPQGRKGVDVWAYSGAIQPVGHDRKQHFHPQHISASSGPPLIRIRTNIHGDSRKEKR
jgi:hypothetical protein